MFNILFSVRALGGMALMFKEISILVSFYVWSVNRMDAQSIARKSWITKLCKSVSFCLEQYELIKSLRNLNVVVVVEQNFFKFDYYKPTYLWVKNFGCYRNKWRRFCPKICNHFITPGSCLYSWQIKGWFVADVWSILYTPPTWDKDHAARVCERVRKRESNDW